MSDQGIHIAIDLETLGLRQDSPVVSVGTVVFTRSAILRTRILRFQWADQRRHPDEDNLRWWFKQDPDIRTMSFGAQMEDTLPTKKGLQLLKDFIATAGEHAHVWADPPSFDLGILKGLYQDLGMVEPWAYNLERCSRTLRGSTPDIEPDEPHNPVSDAIAVAKTVQAAWKKQFKAGFHP